ncbi:MAG TPA: AsmA-like C-terminal region-containing protein [Edaphocola sp.]|nr:AsmA-like C-terminal region-containing protein [Edaphocola sp.]
MTKTLNKKNKNNWKLILTYLLGISTGLVMVFWASVSWYLNSHQKKLIQNIQKTVSENIEGKVSIKNIQLDFFKSFPYTTFRLDNCSIQDSLYPIHKKELLNIRHVYIRLSLLSLFQGSPKVSKVIIENSKFNAYIDSTGYNNAYPLSFKTQKGKKTDLNKIKFELEQCSFSIENIPHEKKFDFTFEELKGIYIPQGDNFHLKLNTQTYFEGLGFNLDLGSFLKKSRIKAKFDIIFKSSEKTFYVKQTNLNLGNESVLFQAKFSMSSQLDYPFELEMNSPTLSYNTAKEWLSENITQQLNSFSFKNDININAKIKGGLTEIGTDPVIDIHFSTQNNEAKAFDYRLEKISFSGYFNNQINKNLPRNDDNSILAFDSIKTEFDHLPINAENISLVNLRTPVVNGRLKADFDARVVNNFFGDQIKVNNGKASYDLTYRGTLFPKTLIAENIFGTIKLKDVDFDYLDRNLHFYNGNVALSFWGKDLSIDTFQVMNNKNDLYINGIAKNFMAAFMRLPEQARIDVNLKSKNLDLSDFQSYLTVGRQTSTPQNTTSDFESSSARLEDFLNNVHTKINLNITKANYKRFQITNLQGTSDFTDSIIQINNLLLTHASGQLQLNANINQKLSNNPFLVNFNIQKVGIAPFFYAMEEFGFSNLTHKNLGGDISIKGNVSGQITEQGDLLKQSLMGTINYQLHQGVLRDFSFFKKIQPWFKSRDLLNIKIPNFSGQLSFDNGYLHIPQTTLNTSVLQVVFWGKYGIVASQPSIINFNIPLRNPQTPFSSNKKRKGIVLEFNAVSDSSGKMKIDAGNISIP